MDEFWNRITFLIGCASIVAIVAVLIWRVSVEVLKTRPVDEEALAGLANNDPKNKAWSGKTASSPALMDIMGRRESPGSVPSVPPPLPTTSQQSPESASISLNSVMTAPPEALSKAVPKASGIGNIEAKREAISATLAKFFEASTIDEKATMVRDPDRVKPLMVSYYARAPMPQYRWRGVGKMVRVEEPGYRFGFVQALFEDSTPASMVIEETSDGRFLVDWEGLVRYGELSWPDFMRMKPIEPTLLRVIASKAEGTPSVAALAPPSSQWLELRHPAETGTVLGYFDRSDPKYARLVEQLELGNWKDVPLTLRLCFPSSPTKLEGLSVRIAGVEGKGWLILAEPKPQS